MRTPDRDAAAAETREESPVTSGISGARVVIAILGALAALVGIVIIGFTVFEPASAPCATGEEAENELVNGQFVPRTELFTSVRDAEAFICHDVPEL